MFQRWYQKASKGLSNLKQQTQVFSNVSFSLFRHLPSNLPANLPYLMMLFSMGVCVKASENEYYFKSSDGNTDYKFTILNGCDKDSEGMARGILSDCQVGNFSDSKIGSYEFIERELTCGNPGGAAFTISFFRLATELANNAFEICIKNAMAAHTNNSPSSDTDKIITASVLGGLGLIGLSIIAYCCYRNNACKTEKPPEAQNLIGIRATR